MRGLVVSCYPGNMESRSAEEKQTRHRQAVMKWQRANPSKQTERMREYRDANPEAIDRHRRTHTAKKYGLTLEQYDALMLLPCQICGEEVRAGERRHAIDHDHACCPDKSASCGSCIRGVLCWNCNTALGALEANWGAATNYLANKIRVI